MYERTAAGSNHAQVKQALELLLMADKKIDKGVRTSMENFGAYGDITVYPLYAML
ncbi:hypothetical protein FACS1894124_8520 [Spirochaetia bacterium]|nr:hypothetical protein FACS1894124_8520 [Spirochaetia bacterium]